MSVSNSPFIFNLGRLWQEVISEDWETAVYLYEFIKEITPSSFLKKYSKEMKKLRFAIQERDNEKVDKVLSVIMGW